MPNYHNPWYQSALLCMCLCCCEATYVETTVSGNFQGWVIGQVILQADVFFGLQADWLITRPDFSQQFTSSYSKSCHTDFHLYISYTPNENHWNYMHLFYATLPVRWRNCKSVFYQRQCLYWRCKLQILLTKKNVHKLFTTLTYKQYLADMLLKEKQWKTPWPQFQLQHCHLQWHCYLCLLGLNFSALQKITHSLIKDTVP